MHSARPRASVEPLERTTGTTLAPGGNPSRARLDTIGYVSWLQRAMLTAALSRVALGFATLPAADR